jgi:hypothetical protein
MQAAHGWVATIKCAGVSVAAVHGDTGEATRDEVAELFTGARVHIIADSVIRGVATGLFLFVTNICGAINTVIARAGAQRAAATKTNLGTVAEAGVRAVQIARAEITDGVAALTWRSIWHHGVRKHGVLDARILRRSIRRSGVITARSEAKREGCAKKGYVEPRVAGLVTK